MSAKGLGSDSSSLLVRLHETYRPRRDQYAKEDLFTEYLAFLLNRSRAFRVSFAELALGEDAEVDAAVFDLASIRTQVNTGDWGIPDLVMEVGGPAERQGERPVPTCRLAIECKVDLSLGEDDSQLEGYHEWLEKGSDGFDFVALAALTPDHLGQGEGLNPAADYPHWQGTFYWHEVRRRLEAYVEQKQVERLPEIHPAKDEFVEHAEFVVLGSEFPHLMKEEDMVAPAPIDPEGEVEQHQQYVKYKNRIEVLLRLIRHAVEAAGIPSRLEELSDATGKEVVTRNEKQGRPIREYHLWPQPDAFFFFGLLVSPPNGYVRRPDELRNADAFRTELIAAFTMRGDGKGDPLSIDRDMLDKVATSLNQEMSPPFKCQPEIFVPEDASYSKWVSRKRTEGWEELDADEQVRKMRAFFGWFVDCFLKTKTAEGHALLPYLREVHEQAFLDARGE